jgi:hypothetical protein
MARLLFRVNATISAALSFASITAFGSACTPPQQLQATLRAHPTADDYAALGDYFGDKGDYQCAAQALTSALKLQPHSRNRQRPSIPLTTNAGAPEPAGCPPEPSLSLSKGLDLRLGFSPTSATASE